MLTHTVYNQILGLIQISLNNEHGFMRVRIGQDARRVICIGGEVWKGTAETFTRRATALHEFHIIGQEESFKAIYDTWSTR